MGGRNHQGAGLEKLVHQRPGERRAFLRIRSRTDFVQQNQIPVADRLQNRDHVSHVRGEGRQALLNRLLIADIDEDRLENRQLAALVGRE